MRFRLAPLLKGSAVVLAVSPLLAFGVSSSASGAPSTTLPPVRSYGSVPKLPGGSRAIGALPGGTSITVDVALRPRDRSALDAFASAVSTPGSPMFRHYLAPGEFAGRFGPTPATIKAVRTWLAGKGLTVEPTSSGGLIVPVHGSASTMAKAFGIGFEQYRLRTGRVARIPTAPPFVPADLAGSVTGVVGLDNLAQPVPQLVHTSHSAAPRKSFGTFAPPSATNGAPRFQPRASPGPQANCPALSAQGLSANQLAQAYSFSALYGSGNEGQGVKIGIYELEPFLQSDIATYENCYSPAITASVTSVAVNGASPNSGAGSGESALDIEMAAGLAPQATLKVYVGSDAGPGASDAEALSTYAAMVDQDSVQVISTSWGVCERDFGTAQIQAEASIFAQAAAQGQTITAPAGDTGSEDCFGDGSGTGQVLAVDDPASQPWVTSVGGSSISSLGPPPAEQVWNNLGAGGGGVSGEWTMPAWQVGPGVRSSFTSSSACPISSGAGTISCREVPDVSANADPLSSPFAEFAAGTWAGVGGTSMGPPLWAALAALADQGQPASVGLMDPALYQAGCLASPPFNDVTSGDNQPPPPYLPTDANGVTLTGGPFYPATSHYDLASGLGTPIVSALVPDLRSIAASSCSSSPPPCNVNDRAVQASGSVRASGVSQRAIPTTKLGFTPLSSPVRIVDTRVGAADPPIYAGDTLCAGGALTIDIPSADVPSGAGAIVAQLSAVTPSAGGFLSIFPAGTANPGTSNVNFTTGQDVGNLATVGLGTDPLNGSQAVTVFNGPAGGTGPDTDVTLDLYGYYAPQSASSGAAYTALTPARIFDTRPGSSEPGQGATLTNGGSVQVPVTGVGGVPSSGVSAIVVNIGITNTSAPSFIQGYPTGSPPSSSTPTVDQNWVAGETLSTKAIIGVGAGGSITLANHDANVDVVVDVDGYFGIPGASGPLFNVLPSPVRLADTRPGGVAGNASDTVAVAGTQGVPSSATAGVLDVVDIATSGNFLTVYPAGQSVPFAADVNYVPGDTDTIVANAAYGTVGSGGAVGIYNGPATTTRADVVVDEFGYFS